MESNRSIPGPSTAREKVVNHAPSPAGPEVALPVVPSLSPARKVPLPVVL
jgi:hypothetical protein